LAALSGIVRGSFFGSAGACPDVASESSDSAAGAGFAAANGNVLGSRLGFSGASAGAVGSAVERVGTTGSAVEGVGTTGSAVGAVGSGVDVVGTIGAAMAATSAADSRIVPGSCLGWDWGCE
jgi:hypothetical protein